MAEKTYVMPPSPEYHYDIRKLQRQDPGDAETVFNPLIQILLENTEFVRLLVEAAKTQNTADHAAIRRDVSTQIATAVKNIPTPDVSGQISAHNKESDAHAALFAVLKDQLDTISNATASAGHTHTADQVGAAPTLHAHTKADITDFPDSMPASDVPGWAKNPNKPTYTAAEVGAAPAEHSHIFPVPDVSGQIADHDAAADAHAALFAALRARLEAVVGGVAESGHTHTADQVGAAPAQHSHTTEDIIGFPESMPASDVPGWAKNPNKPTYTAEEIGALAAEAVAVAAAKLEEARTIRVNLSSTTAASFDGTSNITPGVTGILPVNKGGTGAITAEAARTNLDAAATKHTHSASDITTVIPVSKGGTGFSSLIGTDYTACRIRQIALLSSVPSSLSNGQIALVYV